VTETYRKAFVQFYDDLFSLWPPEMENYALRTEEMRTYFIIHKRSIPILHRDGGYYLLRPINERLRRIAPERLPKYGVYR